MARNLRKLKFLSVNIPELINCYTVAYDFTDEDLRQFQKLASLKLELGLKEAIQAVFGSLADNEQESLNQVIDELYDELSALKQEFKQEMRLIQIENTNLKKKIQDIEESMQTGLLGFVNKRSKNRFG